MERPIKKISRRIEDLDPDGVVTLLERWSMNDFIDFVKEKQIDGRKLMNVSEGIVKLWRPKSNANKLILFIQDLKNDPNKYLDCLKADKDLNTNKLETKNIQIESFIDTVDKEVTIKVEKESKVIMNIESQYQTVKKTKDVTSITNVEELIKKIVPAKSFLYRNQVRKESTPSYLPMDAGSPKKRKLFRISNYDYPKFDFRRFSKQDTGDRGYYPMKRNSRFFVQKSKLPESRPKYKSLSSTEELKYPEDHFYEDLCYNDIEKEERSSVPNQNVKPYRVKIQELFQSFKIPFFKKTEDVIQEDKTVTDTRIKVEEKDGNYYENTESIANMYDSVHVNNTPVDDNTQAEKTKLPVEDYLEPVKLNKDYCDVNYRQRDESILGYIMSIFENRFGMRRETNDSTHSEDSEDEKTDERRWGEDQKPKTSMADRPLPVPVENEPYYMNIDRTEAENLLKGQPDGTFVLRPSSQPTHAYTISVSCTSQVHNVGVRRRSDGRLALGFARRGERAFNDVTSLLRHHKKRRLLLVAGGSVIGATTLNDTPQYYQTPLDEQSTSTLAAEATNGEADPDKNGNSKILRRLETVPDIKRDTSGITTQYIAAGIVNLGAFAAGVCVAWSSSASIISRAFTGNHTDTALKLSPSEASWVTSLLCLGAVWGAVPAGLISEYFGRKKTLLYLALPLVVSWILVGSSPNVYGVYVGRFVGGVALGAFSVTIPPYVEDIAEKQLLPTLANFYHVQCSCGVLFGYIIGLVGNSSWFAVLCTSVPIAFFIAFIFLPESPAYLMTQGKQSEAKSALRYFRGIDNDIDFEIKELREYLRNSAKIKVTFKELFGTRITVKALFVSFGLMIFQQLSGIYAILFYASEIFESFNISLYPPSATIILGFCFVSSTYFSTMLLKVVRRRVLLMLSFAFMTMSLAGLGAYYHMRASNLSHNNNWIPLMCLCVFVSFYAAGAGPIPWLMLREIFPHHLTRRATALTAGVHWFLAFAVTKLYQNLIDKIKPGWTLWHFAVVCLVGTLFVILFVPETKGRTLAEIHDEFDGVTKKKKHRHVIEVESISEA